MSSTIRRVTHRTGRLALLVCVLVSQLPLSPAAAAAPLPHEVERRVEPVILTGADIPGWSSTAVDGTPAPYPSGAGGGPVGFVPGADGVRSAHNGHLTPPADAGTGVPVDEIVAYRWSGTGWIEVPVQVDEVFPNFLANGRSGFSDYSGTDEELTYSWAPSKTVAGEERWKRMWGECQAEYATTPAQLTSAMAAGWLDPGAGEGGAGFGSGRMAPDVAAVQAAYLATAANGFNPATKDPVVGLDADDEIVFMASDAGPAAPLDAAAPAGTLGGTEVRQEVALADPLDPTTVRYVYLFRKPSGPSFDHTNGYVKFTPAANADEFVARQTWTDADPEKLGTSNSGYGANIPGTICTNGSPQAVTDRQPRDGLVVETDAYRWTATGRWMIRALEVALVGQAPSIAGTPLAGRVRSYGADLIDRWKGRAFQQSPDSSVSLVGFEDEQVNWELNATTLGWRAGPVRAIREVWGADSGTNVTKVETFYRDTVAYRYRVRVHPIPNDGLYTSWDYNRATASTYYNVLRPDGVPIDGVNDDSGQVDGFFGFPAFFDVADPTFDSPSAVERWEQVAGTAGNGSLVYLMEFTGATTLANAAAVPYYRDDACLDDGTGDDPVRRPWPGETSDDTRVRNGYVSHWRSQTGNPSLAYGDLGCYNGRGNAPTDPSDSPLTGPGTPGGESLPPHQRHAFQGAFGAHGIHAFATGDSDNLFFGVPNPVNELDFTQWQWAVPMAQPANVGSRYGNTVTANLVPNVTPQLVASTSPGGGVLRAGAAAVDSTWHVGASAGQYASDGSSVGVHGSDPFAHSTRRSPSYGIESREWVKALVLEGSNGNRWAVVSNDLYIPQDLVNQRVGVLLEEYDALAALDPALEPTGITVDNMTVSVSHSHSSPMYTTPSWGVWAFQDVFDVRHYEHMAQKMAEAVITAAQELRPATMAAVEGPVTHGKKHSHGPTVGDDRTPAGYPNGDFDPVMQVMRIDDAANGEPISTWILYGLHPENLPGNDLLTAEYVNTLHTVLDREVGGVSVFSQNETGSSEATEDAINDPTEERAEHSHYEYAQVQRLARKLADSVITLREDVDRLEAGTTPLLATNAVYDDVAGSYFDDDAVVGVKDLRLAPPSARTFPTVSSCRAEKTFDGNPGVPVAGLPDCEYVFGDSAQPFISQLPPELQPAATYNSLREAGVPIPDNVGGPSYTALQETFAVHLQAIRIGDFGVTVCPCEQFADQSRNIKTRLNDLTGDLWYGFDWTANYTDNGPGSDYRTDGPVWEPGVIYDGATDASGAPLPGHGPITLNDWCLASADGSTWSCKRPNDPFGSRVTVSDASFRRMKAQIYNDATGWDRPENSAQAESEPADPNLIWGNYTHEEVGRDTVYGQAQPYDMVATAGMSNDYWGYIVSYREFQRGDHYRKALAGLGPHSSDFLATRLARMAAELNGGPAVTLTAKDLAYQGEAANEKARAAAIGGHAESYLTAYETQMSPDAGDIGSVVTQPGNIERFGAATFRWVGGSNYVDTPDARVERCAAACGTGSPSWVPFGDGFAEVQVRANFPVEEELAEVRAGQFTWEWDAQFEAYDSDIEWTFADGVRRDQVPDGTYRFVVDGCARHVDPVAPGTDGTCASYDSTGRVRAYTATSDSFTVSRWKGITIDALAIATDGSTTFGLGPDFPYPVAYSAVEPDPTRDHVDYPNSYDSVFQERTTGGLIDGDDAFITVRDDAQCLAAGCRDLRTYTDPRRFTGAPEVFCFRCSFEPWHDVSVIETVDVTVRRANGATVVVPATFDPQTGTWSAPTALAAGDEVFVADGGVLDTFGETNRESSHLLRAAVAAGDVSGPEGSPVTVQADVTLPAGADDVRYTWTFGDGTAEVQTSQPQVTHTWADDGTYPVRVVVSNLPAQPDVTRDLTATISNVAPTLQAMPDRTVNVRSGPVTLIASATDPAGDADPLTYTWSFGDGATGSGREVQHTYSCPSGYPCTYTVSVVVDDGDGGRDVETFVLEVVQRDLRVDAGEDRVVDEGDTVQFAASGTAQNTGSALTYDWDFGDGTTAINAGPTPSHTYGEDGVRTVTVTVREPGVGTDSDVLSVTVNNVAPTVTLDGPGSVNEGGVASYTATADDPGSDDTVLVYRWYRNEVLDSTATGPTFSATAGDGPGTLTVRVEAVDSDGAAGEKGASTSITNLVPSVTIDGPTEGVEGATARYTATGTDPYPGDTLTYRWTVDGVARPVTGAVLDVRLPDGPGSVQVAVTAVDDDGGVSQPALRTTTVSNAPPQVTVAGPDGVDEGDEATYTVTVSDPGGDPWTLVWFVDGVRQEGATGRSVTVDNIEGPAVREVRAEVTDDDGGIGEGELHTVVDNVAPRVVLTGPTTAEPGSTSTYRASFTDPGVEDTHAYAWYVDGELVADADGATFELTHPTSRSTQVVRAVVTDDDEGAGQADVTTQVTTAPGDILVTREAGPGRLETAVEISREAFDVARTVVLSRADLYPDALAGAPLAYAVGGPILLSETARLSDATRAELVRLRTESVILLGGEKALSPQVRRDLEAMGIYDIRRLSGPSRFHTAAVIARELGATSAYVTRGGDADPAKGWPDALAVSALAAHQGRAILLVDQASIPQATKDIIAELGVDAADVVGGPSVIDDEVIRQLRSSGVATQRLAGSDRYATSRLIADRAIAAGMTPVRTWMPTGRNWPDALVAGPAVAANGGVLLLIEGQVVDHPQASSWIDEHLEQLEHVRILGGPKAVSTQVESRIRQRAGAR